MLMAVALYLVSNTASCGDSAEIIYIYLVCSLYAWLGAIFWTCISKMILTIIDRVPGTLNPDQRICGFSLSRPEKTNFGDFRKFHAFPEISLRIFLRFLKFS